MPRLLVIAGAIVLLLLAFGAAIGKTHKSHSTSWSFGLGERGSGVMETEERKLDTFTEIECSIGADINITIGPSQRVTLTYDDNLLDRVSTKVRGRTLIIDSRGSFSSDKDCTIDITVPSLEAIDASGSGEITLKGFDADEFTFSLSGSGSFTADGKVKNLSLELSGSGEIDAANLVADDVEIDISGSGDAVVNATKSFNGEVTGSGDIRYIGEPANLSTNVTGSGTIRRAKR